MSCCGNKHEALACGVYNALRCPDDGRNTGNALMLAGGGDSQSFTDADARTENAGKE